MMTKLIHTVTLISVLILLGCGHSAPTNYYLLDSPYGQVTQITREQPHVTIGLGPVTLAKYLDKASIAIRDSTNKINYSDFDQWAEPLDDNIKRVLQENLSYLLPNSHIVNYPWRSRTGIHYQVTVTVISFDTDATGDSLLKAEWSLYSADKRLLYTKTGIYHATAKKSASYQAIATAMSQDLHSLSRDIAMQLSKHNKDTNVIH